MSEVLIRQYGSVASLTLLVYDCILTWEREVQCIWAECRWFTRLSFFISRYLAVGTQIANVVLSTPAMLRWQDGNCAAWFTFQMGAVLVLLANMEIIMMVRVYALYDHKRTIAPLLFVWFIVARVYNAWIMRISLIVMVEDADSLCIVAQTPEDSKWFSLLVIGNQALLWLLTYGKYRRAARDQGWAGNPIVRLVVRDNSWVFLVTAGLLVSLLPYTFYVQQIGHIIFSLLTCTFSILSSRLILNILSLKRIPECPGQVALSTVLPLSEIESCITNEARISSVS